MRRALNVIEGEIFAFLKNNSRINSILELASDLYDDKFYQAEAGNFIIGSLEMILTSHDIDFCDVWATRNPHNQFMFAEIRSSPDRKFIWTPEDGWTYKTY